MKNNTVKKETIGGLIGINILFVVLIALFAVVLFFARGDISYALGITKPVELNEMLEKGEPVKGKYVEVNVDAMIDWYAEMKHTVNGIPVGKEQYCIIWLDNSHFISLTVKGKADIETLDDISDATWDYLDENTDYLAKGEKFVGKIETIDGEISGYYDDAIEQFEMDSTMVYNYTINASSSKGSIIAINVLLIAIIALFIWAFIVNIKKIKRLKEEKQRGFEIPSYSTADSYGNGADASGQRNAYGSSIYNGSNTYSNGFEQNKNVPNSNMYSDSTDPSDEVTTLLDNDTNSSSNTGESSTGFHLSDK